jgi:hypothetical protein
MVLGKDLTNRFCHKFVYHLSKKCCIKSEFLK